MEEGASCMHIKKADSGRSSLPVAVGSIELRLRRRLEMQRRRPWIQRKLCVYQRC